MKSKTFRERAIRHGELVITPVDKLPDGLEVVSSGRQVIIGHSESGHHHVAVCDDADLRLLRPVGADSPDLYLEVSAVGRVEHLKQYDRHETKAIAPGYYHINTKMAYDYFAKRAVRVID